MEVEKGDERVSNWEWNLNKRQIDCEHTHSLMVNEFFHLCDRYFLSSLSRRCQRCSFINGSVSKTLQHR